MARLHREAAHQQAFAQQLIAAQETERQRIATELHDGLGQELLIMRNRALLGTVASRNDDHESAGEHLDEIAATAGDAINEVRQIAYNLRPYHLDRLGLRQAIEEMVARVRASSSLEIDVDVAALEGAVASDAAINCYRIVQECLSNIVRHAGATTASIRAAADGHEVRLAIADNETGFESAARPCRGQDGRAWHGWRGRTGENARRLAHRGIAPRHGHDDYHPLPGERWTERRIMSAPMTIFVADDHPILPSGTASAARAGTWVLRRW